MTLDNSPQQKNLRLGRVSLAGSWYSITTCIEGRRNLLVSDPFNPIETGDGAAIALTCIEWLQKSSRLICHGFCVMPDHVHMVVELQNGWPLPKVMNSFKTFTSRKAGEVLGIGGKFWQKAYHDHCLRNDELYEKVIRYILENPVRKGFVEKVEDWPWGGTIVCSG